MAEMPEYMTELGYPAGRMYSEDVVAAANTLGQELFGIGEIATTFFRPSLYLSRPAIAAAKLDFGRVATELAAALGNVPGIGLAKSTVELLAREHTGMARQMQRNTHPQRSGDIYVAQAPYWFMFEKGAIAAMHGSPWGYDTHVPIIIVGPNTHPQQVSREVYPVDVAPTLSALLGIPAPAGAQGTVLTEVFD